MVAAVRVATFPFRAVFRLILFLFLPVGLGVLTWWLSGVLGVWVLWLTGFCAVWAVVMVRLWLIQMHGELRSLERGTVHLDSPRRPRRLRLGRGDRW